VVFTERVNRVESKDLGPFFLVRSWRSGLGSRERARRSEIKEVFLRSSSVSLRTLGPSTAARLSVPGREANCSPSLRMTEFFCVGFVWFAMFVRKSARSETSRFSRDIPK